MSAFAISPEQLQQAIGRLPALPRVVHQLLQSLEKPNVDVGAVANDIAQDPALTAKTLRLANSSFYGMARQISSVDQAITVLGFRTVRSIATTAALVRQGAAMAAPHQDLKPLWRHATACALVARELAAGGAISPDIAYTTGLLHDIGRLVLWTQFPAEQNAVTDYRNTHDCHWAQAEQMVLGFNHCQVGQRLCTHWQLPGPICEAVAMHHGTELAGNGLPVLIAGADAVAHAMLPDWSNDANTAVPPLPTLLWERLHIGEDRLLRIMQTVHPQVAELEPLFVS